ncbi:sulfotransferase family protein [Thiohalorhabdus sp.]|uniref:sulfotransferase family protein n=1 Tax=Thiohalorhabdus sp. TaxID=3094134 RepID=UPI002FC30371
MPRTLQMGLYFQLGGLLDKAGDYGRAFEAFEQANALKPREYHPEQQEALFRRIREQYTADFLARAPRAGHGSRRPIFIVGMPRSGISLTEQILASHPDVHGAGELEDIGPCVNRLAEYTGSTRAMPVAVNDATSQALDQAAGDYLNRLAELVPEETPRVSDKMPHNFLNLGAMALMFPEATFIHTRRDPRDTCLSCYFQNFLAQGLTFAYDLRSLGHYYRLYEGLMAHWREALPGSLYDLQYEELVADPETKVAELLDHCGLEWDDRCMRFFETDRDTKTASYDQVRKPLYTSSAGRWQRYADPLGPLVEELGLESEG